MTTIVDTFDRADSASALGTTSDGTATWVAQSGTWGISSNRAYCPSGVGLATVDFGSGDGYIQATVVTGTTVSEGVAFRVNAPSACWIATGSDLYQVSGSFNSVASYSIPVGHVIQVVLSGSSVTVKDATAGTTVATVTSSFLSTETKHGLYAEHSTARFDDFYVGTSAPTGGGSTDDTSGTWTRSSRTFTTAAVATGAAGLHTTRVPRTFTVAPGTITSVSSGRPDAPTVTGWGRTARTWLTAAEADPPVDPPPAAVTTRLYRRSSYTVTPPTFAGDGWSNPTQVATPVDTSDWGRHRLVFDFTDRTYFRGVPIRLVEDSHANPFGHELAVFHLPQVSPFERPGSGALAWLHEGTHVRVSRVNAAGHIDHTWAWLGHVHNITPEFSDTGWGFTVEAKGFLYQGDDYQQKPLPTAKDRADIGSRLAETLNVLGRHYPALTAVTTGIQTAKRGSLSQKATEFARELLGDAWTTDGRQWTVMTDPWATAAAIILPDPTTVDYTISLGQPGCDFTGLHEENDELPNVVYGEWIDPDGGRHQRLKYPRLHEDLAPAYPLTVGAVFNPGSSTTGFAPFADWMRRNGFAGFDSDDTYLASDSDDVRDQQARMGVTVDGIVGAQTWGTAFNTGADIGDLRRAVYLPLAHDLRVEPFLYAPDGTKLGANPAYDATRRRKETYVNFGEGLTYRDVRRAAEQIVARSTSGISLVGQIICKTDPEETSWLNALSGTTVRARYLYGTGTTGVRFHLARIHRAYDDDGGVTTTLDVDTKWRDAYTIAQIIERNKAARDDPARLIRRRQTSGLAQDTKLQFDADDVGKIYRHNVQGGFWRIVEFPAATWGTFVRVTAVTSPATEFALMLFAKEITARDLDRLVGNPLSTAHPYNPEATALKEAGLIQAWGSSDQPAGYSKTGAADGYKSDGNTLTGRLEYDSSVDFAPDNGASLFLAEWCRDSTVIHERLDLQPVTL